MSTDVKSVKALSKRAAQLEDVLRKLWSARTAKEVQNVSGHLRQYITEQEGLLKAARSSKETVTFYNWLKMMAKDLKMVEASKILNKNAWKIGAMLLVPGYGNDPETEWTGFLTFYDVKDLHEFRFDEDDYRTILKQMAVLSEILDIGE